MKTSLKIFYLALATFVSSLLIGFFGIYLGIFPNAPDMHRKDDIVGSWISDYSYDSGGIIIRMNTETSYFSNGNYNVDGEISYQPNRSTNIIFAVNGSGVWTIHKKELITTLNNLKSTPEKMYFNGHIFDSNDFDMMERLSNEKLKTIEDFTASGVSQTYIIRDDSRNIKLLEAINPFGENYNIKMYRTK